MSTSPSGHWRSRNLAVGHPGRHSPGRWDDRLHLQHSRPGGRWALGRYKKVKMLRSHGILKYDKAPPRPYAAWPCLPSVNPMLACSPHPRR